MTDRVLHVWRLPQDSDQGPKGRPSAVREYTPDKEPALPAGWERMTAEQLKTEVAKFDTRVEEMRAAGLMQKKPEPRQPWHTVSLAQAHVATVEAGLYDQINSLIDALPGPRGNRARIAWRMAPTISIDSELVTLLWPQLKGAGNKPLTQADKEALFQAAHQVTF